MVKSENGADPQNPSITTNPNLRASITSLSSDVIKSRVVSRQVLKALGQRDPLYEAAGIIALKRGLISVQD